MRFSDLPDDVLYDVLRWAFNYDIDMLHEFKRNLPLLAVCQRWRHAALPMVYSTTAVRVNPCLEPVDSGSLHAQPGGSVVESNAWLVASAGCAQTVKSARIEVNCSGNPSAALREAAEFMRSVTSEWGGVKSLVLKLGPPGQLSDEPDSNIEAACDAIAAVFPAVSELCFSAGIFGRDAVAGKIYGGLAGLYAGQLERLEVEHPVDIPREVVLKRLKRLDLRYHHRPGDQLPRMDPDVVEVLNLGSLPQSQVWAAFGPDMASREIRLPRLKALRLVQLEDFAEDMWRLHLPSLEWLEVRTSHVPSSLLEHMTLPPRMTTIKITAGPAVLRAVARMALPAVQRLEIDIPFGANNDVTALPVANHILSNVRASKQAALIFRNSVSSVSPDGIICTTLTRLSVGTRTRADVVFALIRKLPGLVTAGFWSISVDDVQTDISVPGPDDTGLAEPFNAKIKRLIMGVSAVLFPEQFAAVVKYMMLRMPVLTWLHVPRAIRGLMEEFVCAYSKRYPHLKHVRLSFI